MLTSATEYLHDIASQTMYYGVPLWGFHVTIIAVETQRCIFVFPHKLINFKTFWKRFIEHKMYVLVFSTILPEIFLILKIINREIF
jgi:hypothetical protein